MALSPFGTPKRSSALSDSMFATETMPRRVSQGAVPRRNEDKVQYQPQDGAAKLAGRVMDFSSRRLQLSGEPEDARLTGGTRSLMRRLSGLNMVRKVVAKPPRTVGHNTSMGNANVA